MEPGSGLFFDGSDSVYNAGMSAFADEADALSTNTGVRTSPNITEEWWLHGGEVRELSEHEHTEECYTLAKKCIHEHDRKLLSGLREKWIRRDSYPSEGRRDEKPSR